MSIPGDDDDDDGAGARRVLVILRAVAALSACVSLAALWSVERTQLTHDLQLAAPASARPGEQIALRALVFRDIDAPEGPTLVAADTRVRLLDDAGRELGATSLSASALTTLDGALPLPTSRTGPHVLEARTFYDGRELVCRRPLAIAADAPRAPLHGREAGALQQLSLGRVRAVGAGLLPPGPLLPRVIGGACMPETPCRVMVWVGAPAAAIAVRPGSGVSLTTGPDPAETEGLIEFAVQVAGLDAQLTLEARRGGVAIAERSVRLPVGLGEVRIDAASSWLDAPLPVALTPPPGRRHVLLDIFSAGRWRDARVIADAASAHATLDPAAMPPGMIRLQARTDPFGSEGASARVVYRRAPGESDAAALATIAGQLADEPALRGEPTAAWADALPPGVGADRGRAVAFLLAPLEQLRADTPRAVSGRPAALAQLSRTKVRMRVGVAVALALSALVIAFSIARRGWSAVSEAEAILAAGREESDPASRMEGMKGRVTVLLVVLAVASAFLAGALLIVAKPLWF